MILWNGLHVERDNSTMCGTVWEWMKKFIPTSSSSAFYHSLFPCRKLYFVFPPLLSIKQRLKQMSRAALILSVWSEQCLIIRETLMWEESTVTLLPADRQIGKPAQSVQTGNLLSLCKCWALQPVCELFAYCLSPGYQTVDLESNVGKWEKNSEFTEAS